LKRKATIGYLGQKYNGVVCDPYREIIAVGDRMFLRKQDFDFAQIQLNLPKSNHFCPNYFASILPKFRLNFAQI